MSREDFHLMAGDFVMWFLIAFGVKLIRKVANV